MWVSGVICMMSWLAAGVLWIRGHRCDGGQGKQGFFENIADGILSCHITERMCPETVKRLLQQLYPTGEVSALCRRFYREKLSLILKIWFAGIHLIMFLEITELSQPILSEGNCVQRGQFGESEKELFLEVRTEDDSAEDILYKIYARKYTQEEIKVFVNRFSEQLEKLICKENKNLQEVRSDLQLKQMYEDFPMQFSWESEDDSLIDENGNVNNENLTTEKTVKLTAVMTYEETEFEHSVYVRICPKKQTEKERWRNRILVAIENADEKQKYSEKLLLPSEIDGKKVSYTTVKETPVPLCLFFLFIIVVLLFFAKDSDLKKETEERRKKLGLKYPEFVSKFQLLLGAGMTVRNIFLRLSEDDSLGGELCGELKLLVRDMKNGLPAKESLDRFGKRCSHPLYMKFSALLSQNLKKGTGDLLDQLSGETAEAFMLRKTQARQLGEEAGTKLLGPMVLMLAIVMAVLMIPAFLSFQF